MKIFPRYKRLAFRIASHVLLLQTSSVYIDETQPCGTPRTAELDEMRRLQQLPRLATPNLNAHAESSLGTSTDVSTVEDSAIGRDKVLNHLYQGQEEGKDCSMQLTRTDEGHAIALVRRVTHSAEVGLVTSNQLAAHDAVAT
ncbi:unnamed protein product [Haemonchus placei]|uniref:Uncharacterized protein n=1 Tax=Haemonchus placei TaxID=6290 RepID=A0A0N4WCX0_HAEPC|nr:unnamed protein product [Haemonchus placei]